MSVLYRNLNLFLVICLFTVFLKPDSTGVPREKPQGVGFLFWLASNYSPNRIKTPPPVTTWISYNYWALR